MLRHLVDGAYVVCSSHKISCQVTMASCFVFSCRWTIAQVAYNDCGKRFVVPFASDYWNDPFFISINVQACFISSSKTILTTYSLWYRTGRSVSLPSQSNMTQQKPEGMCILLLWLMLVLIPHSACRYLLLITKSHDFCTVAAIPLHRGHILTGTISN